MAEFLVFASRSPWEWGGGRTASDLAFELATAGHSVTLYLVQNGVLAAREGVRELPLERGLPRLRVVADDFSLRERAIGAGSLRKGIQPASIESAVELLARGARAFWL
jgi:hypothetical protein